MSAINDPQRIIADLERALRRVEDANQAAGRIQHDHCTDPVVRSAISLLTADTRVAELWRDLRAGIQATEKQLSELIEDLDALDHEFPLAASEADQAREGEQRRGNGAAPSAASIAPVEDRHLHSDKTGDI
jgi:hypothetical protein